MNPRKGQLGAPRAILKLRSYAKTAAEVPRRAQGAERHPNLGAVSSVCSLHPFLPPTLGGKSA